MPKVDRAYFENKRNAILDAAERICSSKPLYKLTMKDLINQTGMSPGAVYASFSDVDDVIIGMINRLSAIEDFVGETQSILQSSESPEDKVAAMCKYFVRLIYATVGAYGKYIHELETLLSQSARVTKIQNGLHEVQMFGYVREALAEFVDAHIKSGYFSPAAQKEAVFGFAVAFLDGLNRDLILFKCYNVPAPLGITFEENDIAENFAAALIHLLNKKEAADHGNTSNQ